jgi:hypothetical protein
MAVGDPARMNISQARAYSLPRPRSLHAVSQGATFLSGQRVINFWYDCIMIHARVSQRFAPRVRILELHSFCFASWGVCITIQGSVVQHFPRLEGAY